MRTLVTGARGFLGTHLMQFLEGEVKGTTRENHSGLFVLDITQRKQVFELMEAFKPHRVVHCAAIADPAYCEANSDEAYRVNAGGGAQNVAQASASVGAQLFLASTDFVYDGVNTPHTEDQPIVPLNVYGRTKALAEQYTLDAGGIVLRLSGLYGYNAESGPNQFVGQLLAGQRVFADDIQPKNFLWLDDVSRGIEQLTGTASSIYNFGGPAAITKFALAKSLNQHLQMDNLTLEPITTDDPRLERPKNLTLSLEKALAAGISLTPVEEAAEHIVYRIRN